LIDGLEDKTVIFPKECLIAYQSKTNGADLPLEAI
jgi:hypothetical protein